jgi:hypothetical protein
MLNEPGPSPPGRWVTKATCSGLTPPAFMCARIRSDFRGVYTFSVRVVRTRVAIARSWLRAAPEALLAISSSCAARWAACFGV